MPPDPFVWIKGRPIELFIESFSNAARTLQVRGFTLNEQIITDHTTSADRSLATSVVPITGIPNFLTVTLAETGVSRGECYVRISVRVEGVVVAILGANYVSDTGTIVFPGGKNESSIEGPGLIRSITGTNPAAGVEISETVPTGALWFLRSLRATFVADVTVINRTIRLRYDDGALTFFEGFNASVTTASATAVLIASVGTNFIASGSGGRQPITMPDLRLPAGFRFFTVTSSLQAGDNWGPPQFLVEEWIEP